MFRRIREMKAMLEGADALSGQAQVLGAGGQQLAMAQQAVRQARLAQGDGRRAAYGLGDDAPAVYSKVSPNFQPIAGVSLETYAAIVKCAAAFGHDPSKMADAAAARGISSVALQMAVTGWNARLRSDAAVARRFNLRYWEA